jgi:hypothetical protein
MPLAKESLGNSNSRITQNCAFWKCVNFGKKWDFQFWKKIIA